MAGALMRLSEIVEKLGLRVKGASERLDRDVTRGYVSDLLSDVLSHAEEGDLWITLQTHQNIVAVAAIKSLAGIILVNGREPESETLQKAKEEGIPIMISELPAFEVVGRLFEMGLAGS